MSDAKSPKRDVLVVVSAAASMVMGNSGFSDGAVKN